MVKFTEEESKLIADFYVKNYKILTSTKRLPAVNERRKEKILELLHTVNAMNPDNPKTLQMLKEKIQSLKKSTKKKVTSNSKERSVTSGAQGKTVQLSAAEKVFAANSGNTSAFAGATRNDSEDEEDDEDEEELSEEFTPFSPPPEFYGQDDQELHAQFDLEQVQQQVQVPESDMADLNPNKSSTTSQKRKESKKTKSDIAAQQQRILDLQEQVLSAQLKATNEFRQAVVEFRFTIRANGPLKDQPMMLAEDLLPFATGLVMETNNEGAQG